MINSFSEVLFFFSFFLFLAQIEKSITRGNQEHPPRGNQRETKKQCPSGA